MRFTVALLATGLSLSVLAGCGLAPSVHPLSDDESTRLDERLIGCWHGLKGEEGAETKRSPEQLFVGRREGSESELEAVWLELKGERVRVQRLQVRTTKIGEHRFLSATSEELKTEEEPRVQVWLLARYRMLDAHNVLFWPLSPEVTLEAIEAGELAGKVKGKIGNEGGSEYEGLLVTADTAALRTWVMTHALEAFPAKDPGRLRRADAPDEVDPPEEDE